ncbi:hypothetical protein ACWT_4232 [Actinoplanes sp. SE50]|uniref:hypothetical protein n=1 Tax=unclassified Actinoplanes TaxID=2626549 RepID=UPI00023EC490|nr:MULTISPECIES: hypothetical protein [unclassified Actinoplanes]AEV85252.1 hypothetical protein ACPL_4361 [Actinoplanes sp. SE50/110]ATO83647.1 hypothetical protein ACWT_4232 [Actinoplanes sp. SE50]SLM01055.1 hypothetical protein ACSP50_4288 [Actinoplanes sp. SE50/110]
MQLRDDYLSGSALAERGWTPAAIRRFLGAPDRTSPRPGFCRERVVAAEQSEPWRRWRAGAVRRSARGRAVVDARRAALLAQVAALDIRVPVLASAALAELAVAHRHRGYRVDEVDRTTLRRWMVDYLRQQATLYDAALDAVFATVGRAEATVAIRNTVYAVIAAAYPELAGEARRQVAEHAAAVPARPRRSRAGHRR